MGRSPEQPLTGEVARELCQRAGSKAMIAGSIAALGGEYVIGLHAVNCASGDPLVSEQARASGKGDVLKALDSSASAMRTRLGESLASVQKFSAPIEEATTPSLEALKAYALGRRANNEKGDAATVPYHLRAVELDPNFAIAYASLAIAYSNLGQPGRAVEAARKAYDLRDRVSEREKYRIMAYYYMVGVGDLPKAIQACEFWKQNYPRDNVAATNLGANYMWVGQWEKAIGDTELTISLDPAGAVPYSNLAIIQLALNRYDDARATLEQAFARKIDAYFIHLDAYEEAFLRGDTQAMQRHVAAVAGRPGEEDWLISAQGDTEAYFGRARQAREFSRRAAESARLADAPEAAALWHAEAALRDAEMGHAAAAREGAVKALDLMSGRDVRSLAALALARAGDAARAQKLADRLDKEFPQNTHVQQYWLPSMRAALALDAKDAARALEILEPAKAIDLAQAGPFEFGMMYPPYLRGQAYLLAQRGKEAAAEFQKLVDRPGLLKNFVLFPLARLGSARAHALEGNRERSRADYDLFLELWKTADADVPLLQQARAESARMR
jgi:tetratricopeptide (TPR) repeat protein